MDNHTSDISNTEQMCVCVFADVCKTEVFLDVFMCLMTRTDKLQVRVKNINVVSSVCPFVSAQIYLQLTC